jgi:hypothetical protein
MTIVKELQALRKGAGMQTDRLNDLLGPALRKLGAAPQAPGRTDRRVLADKLQALARRIPREQAMAALVALAVWPQTRNMSLFKDRVTWFAQQTHCSFRTALRRIDEGQQRLAEEIEIVLARTADANGWVLAELDTLFLLDTETPLAREERRIRATEDGLSEIKTWWDFPRAGNRDPDIHYRVVHGGQLVRHEDSSGRQLALFIELPRPLAAGEEHRIGVELRPADITALRPHYIFVPEMPCDRFNLRVRVNGRRMPRAVRAVRGEMIRTFDAAAPGPDLLTPDAAKEITLTFEHLELRLGYGAQWWY